MHRGTRPLIELDQNVNQYNHFEIAINYNPLIELDQNVNKDVLDKYSPQQVPLIELDQNVNINKSSNDHEIWYSL